MRVGSLFAGIGGFDIATEAMGWETVWFSQFEPDRIVDIIEDTGKEDEFGKSIFAKTGERFIKGDPYCCRVLEKRWPSVPNHGDITVIDWDAVEPVDVLTGGFPCQDISVAGKGAGIAEGTRSGLWAEYARAIRHLRPRVVIVENVGALLVRGAARVFGDLAALGYDAEWQVLSAAAVGAPHRRERVWIVAHREGTGLPQWQPEVTEGARQDGRTGPAGGDRATPEGAMAHGDGRGRNGSGLTEPAGQQSPPGSEPDGRGGVRGQHDGTWWATPKSETSGPDYAQRGRDGSGGDDLVTQVGSAKLNPDWVETLMGYPIGWTDIDATELHRVGWPAGPGQRPNWPTPDSMGERDGAQRRKDRDVGGSHGESLHHALHRLNEDAGQYPWEPPRVTDRKEHRRNRLKALGNAIVPACALAILEGFMVATEREVA